jgi:hypothetical protein
MYHQGGEGWSIKSFNMAKAQDENSRMVTRTGKQNAAAYITMGEKDGVSKALRWQRHL